MTHTPSIDTPGESNASHGDPVKPQTTKQIYDLVMDWMDEEKLNYERAATSLGISRHNLINILNGYQFSDDIRNQMANIIPGVNSCQT